jgi:predicted Rossmann fold nucleotide-binding protein DprA/Smf involved in DNA uptake
VGILEALGWPVERVATPEAVPRLDGEEEQVFAYLELTPQTPAAPAARRQLSAASVARSLVALECRGLVMVLLGRRYVRRFAGGATG